MEYNVQQFQISDEEEDEQVVLHMDDNKAPTPYHQTAKSNY